VIGLVNIMGRIIKAMQIKVKKCIVVSKEKYSEIGWSIYI
jgi:hypothetical protein